MTKKHEGTHAGRSEQVKETARDAIAQAKGEK